MTHTDNDNSPVRRPKNHAPNRAISRFYDLPSVVPSFEEVPSSLGAVVEEVVVVGVPVAAAVGVEEVLTNTGFHHSWVER